MAQSIPRRVYSKEYIPRSLRQAMYATRLANAAAARAGLSQFRYIIDMPIHEAAARDVSIPILDSVEGKSISYAELLERLPEDLRKRIIHS